MVPRQTVGRRQSFRNGSQLLLNNSRAALSYDFTLATHSDQNLNHLALLRGSSFREGAGGHDPMANGKADRHLANPDRAFHLCRLCRFLGTQDVARIDFHTSLFLASPHYPTQQPAGSSLY